MIEIDDILGRRFVFIFISSIYSFGFFLLWANKTSLFWSRYDFFKKQWYDTNNIEITYHIHFFWHQMPTCPYLVIRSTLLRSNILHFKHRKLSPSSKRMKKRSWEDFTCRCFIYTTLHVGTCSFKAERRFHPKVIHF